MTNTYNAALLSSPSSTNGRYRTTHHQRTKQHGKEEQRYLDKWTREEILEGKGPWVQAGEYRHPQEELEAANAERKHYEELARLARKPKRQPLKKLGWHTGSVAESGFRPEPTPRAYRKEPRTEPDPVRAELEVSNGSEAETVKELMGRLEERVMRELLCWCTTSARRSVSGI